MHHKIDVAVSAAHVADKTPASVAPLKKAKAGIGFAMPVILWPPALRLAAPNAEPKCFSDPHDRHVSFNPRNVRAGDFLELGHDLWYIANRQVSPGRHRALRANR